MIGAAGRWGSPADEDREEAEPAARVGPNGSRDRRSLLLSLPEEREREGSDVRVLPFP